MKYYAYIKQSIDKNLGLFEQCKFGGSEPAHLNSLDRLLIDRSG